MAPDSVLILEILEPDLPIKPPIIVSEITISSVTYSAAKYIFLR